MLSVGFDPINVPALFSAILWPAITVGAIYAFRKPIAGLVNTIGTRATKLSGFGLSLELATLTELRPASLDIDLRELDAGSRPQSGPIDLLKELRAADARDYIVIDLGSGSSPRWLTSRLYLFGLLLSRVGRVRCFVFVETAGEIRNRFIGTASPEAVRWALARRYPWLEQAYALAYSTIGLPQFDPSTDALSEYQATTLVQQFLANIRVPGSKLTFPAPNKVPDTIDLGNGVLEYAKWIDGGRIERLLGAHLSTASVIVAPDKRLDDMSGVVLGLRGRFVAIVESDRTFRGLLDRHAALEKLAQQATPLLERSAKV